MTFLKVAFVIFLMSIICGPIFALFITPIYRSVLSIFYIPFVRQKKIDEAIAKGHVVTGYILKSTTILEDTRDGSLRSSGQRYVEYEYEYNGKKYKYMGKTASDYPDTITLYFDENPKYADVAASYMSFSYNWKKTYLRVALVLTVLIAIMGIYYVVKF